MSMNILYLIVNPLILQALNCLSNKLIELWQCHVTLS